MGTFLGYLLSRNQIKHFVKIVRTLVIEKRNIPYQSRSLQTGASLNGPSHTLSMPLQSSCCWYCNKVSSEAPKTGDKSNFIIDIHTLNLVGAGDKFPIRLGINSLALLAASVPCLMLINIHVLKLQKSLNINLPVNGKDTLYLVLTSVVDYATRHAPSPASKIHTIVYFLHTLDFVYQQILRVPGEIFREENKSKVI